MHKWPDPEPLFQNFDAAVAFYSRLFGAAPAKLRSGYANFATAR
jgi:hypothetical protein